MQASMLQSKWYHKPHVTTKSWKEAVVMVEGLAKWQERVYILVCESGSDIVISLILQIGLNWTMGMPSSCQGQFFHDPPPRPTWSERCEQLYLSPMKHSLSGLPGTQIVGHTS